jgi:hypothetical protein
MNYELKRWELHTLLFESILLSAVAAAALLWASARVSGVLEFLVQALAFSMPGVITWPALKAEARNVHHRQLSAASGATWLVIGSIIAAGLNRFLR